MDVLQLKLALEWICFTSPCSQIYNLSLQNAALGVSVSAQIMFKIILSHRFNVK